MKAIRLYLHAALLVLGLSLHQTLPAGPVPTNKPAAYPAWWFERDVIPRLPASANNPTPVWPTDYASADDYAVANLGQLKHIATKAAAELDAKLPAPGAGPTVQAWVAAWQAAPTPGVVRDDYAALNLGQLKAVAQPFYDRLIEKGYATKYPWTDSASPKDDYALLNIGQLKNLFSMDLSELINNEGDQNSLPDAWQLRYFGQTGVDPNADPNRNGVSNWHEYLEGTDPTLDYYQGVTPVLIAIQGNRQASLPGKFLALPWKVLVRRPDGSPWIGAPVRFTAAAEEGLLAPEPTETAQLSSALTVISDSEGYAQVWLKCP